MFRFFLAAWVVILASQTAMADATRLSERQGRWICSPSDPAWPQILIDFTENAYRRCDQNTCVTYPVLAITDIPAQVRVAFAPGSFLQTADSGGPYEETLKIAGIETRTKGACMFRGDSDVYPPDDIVKDR